MAVTCEVEAPSAMAFWKRWRSSCHLAVCTGSRDNGNDAQLLPKLGDGAQNGAFGHFPAQRMGQLGKGRVAGFQQFVGLDGQLRNLARTGQLRSATPVAVAAQSIDVGQNPTGHHKIGELAGQAEQIQAHGHTVCLQADQQLFSQGNVFWIGGGVALAATASTNDGAIGRGKLPLGQEET
jgi:hypothetical protein